MTSDNNDSILFNGNGKFKELCTNASIEAQNLKKCDNWIIRKLIEAIESFDGDPNLSKSKVITLCLNLKAKIPNKLLKDSKSSITILVNSLENLLKESF